MRALYVAEANLKAIYFPGHLCATDLIKVISFIDSILCKYSLVRF